MRKSSLYLDENLDEALADAAARRRVSKAEFIRQALDKAVREDVPPRFGAVGVIKGGPSDLAANDERYLAETGFGED